MLYYSLIKHNVTGENKMNKGENFHTFKGYQLINNDDLTPAMEDYLEMIHRIEKSSSVVRIKNLSESLNVKPSSTSKMIHHLKSLGYVDFKKYGYISLSEKGNKIGEFLILRHNVLYQFFKNLTSRDDVLEMVEKIEHFIDPETVKEFQLLNEKLTKEQK